MKSDPGWDDLACFCAVARSANLTHAARTLGISAPTLSRRMKALEARMGRRLFLHGADGYTPTAEGRALLDRATRMEAVAADIAQWRERAAGPARVRLLAGSWTSLHLATHLPDYWAADCAWVPEFLFCNRDMDIARREVDIGVRNRRPEQPWLAGRRTGTVDYAAYGRDGTVTGWIGASADAAPTPSATWLRNHYADAIVTTANDPRLALAMAEAGIGRIVLPRFIGDTAPRLTRLSDPIAELQSEEWLVCHHEARHDPPIRAALEALAGFLGR